MVMTRHSDDDLSDPKDEDLDALFDRVWAGYSPDTSTKSDANESKLNGSKWSLNNELPEPSPVSSPSKTVAARPPARVRPLPPTPGSSTTTSPVSQDRGFRHTSFDGYVSSTDSMGRQLPPPPGSSVRTSDSPSLFPSLHLDSPIADGIPPSNGTHISGATTSPQGSIRPSVLGSQSVPAHTYVESPIANIRDHEDTPEYTSPTSPFSAAGLKQGSTYSASPPEPWLPPGAPSPYDGYVDGSITRSSVYVNSPSPAAPLDAGLARGDSTGSHAESDHYFSFTGSSASVAGPSNFSRRPTDLLQAISTYEGDKSSQLELQPEAEEEDQYWEDEEEDENLFVNFSLLSHIAVQLRDKVPRGTHVKGSIPYPRAFTGKDIVSTIQSQIQRELAINHGFSTSDRRAALQVARSLQSQLFFYEVEWGGQVLQDGVEDVYMFLDDLPGASDEPPERAELPTGVVTVLTKCYSPGCDEGTVCYSPRCPRKGDSVVGPSPGPETTTTSSRQEWINTVPREVLVSLPESEISRQTIIHKLIDKEEQYIQDLNLVESVFIRPLRNANPAVIPSSDLDDFIDEVFGNILDLRECNRRLLEVMYVRQREQFPVIQRIGDVFLDAATEFRWAYPVYIGHHPLAEKRLKEETENNSEFRLFIEQCARDIVRPGESMRLDLKLFLNRPSEHLQKYPVLLEAIYNETAHGNPDGDFLLEAIDAIKNLQSVAQLRTFQSAMGRGAPGKWEWHDLVSNELRQSLTKDECKRQSIIFELIKGEMAYVKDLENIDVMYIRPLRAADPPIVPREALEKFITDVFHNFAELHAHHRRLVEKFHEIQREEHPVIRTITAAVFDAALNFRDAYMEYIPNYPIAAYRIDDEMNNNPAFKQFVEQCVKHPDAHRLDMKSFINRPIPRLLRYELLLKGILDETPPGHDDKREIPEVLDVIKALGKDTEPGVVSAKQKVELWRYNSNITFKNGEWIDMDLLDDNRSLIHTGKLLRQPDGGLEWNGWSELFVLLFDNYLVMTKPREDRNGVLKYHVNRRPIPLDLLTLVNFTDPPAQRGTGLLRNLRGERHDSLTGNAAVRSPESASDSRSVFPCTIHHNGRLGGNYILYAESAQVRSEWKQKLDEAMGLRKVVQESNKVFEVETLSSDTFLVPSIASGQAAPSWNLENSFTGKVTCSVPFNTSDGRGLVAIGCAEGVWIGFRHDSRSMRRVLHLKMVTQCAMLEDFGIFLVLADKSLFAYHIEALVPSSPQSSHASQTPQKLNGSKDVLFFSVGMLQGRTLLIYMRRKGLESIFHVVEPVVDKINEKVKSTPAITSRFGFRTPKSDWFRHYREFFVPSEAYDVIFLKAKIAILFTKGFEIMDLMDFKSKTIPTLKEGFAPLAKRCEGCRPLGMFRSKEHEFLLCYDEFGLYVDKHGEPSRPTTGTIEWEGTAERVAIHSPYILLFDTRFIEVRHIQTGRLVQIIPGHNMHCIWDGRGTDLASANIATPGVDEERMIQDARIHSVSSNDSMFTGRHSRAVAQHVFELVPTLPLYLPGSLSSPSTATYFPRTYSPPHSPQLRANHSFSAYSAS